MVKFFEEIVVGGEYWNLVVLDIIEKASGTSCICRCACGNEATITKYRITSGRKKSCGCGKNKGSHRYTGTRTYTSWLSMKARCLNSESDKRRYADYGGRGITICDRWLGKGGFKNFLEDMGERPDGTSLERLDVDKNYEPDNCKWAGASEQGFNKRKNPLNTSGRVGVEFYKARGNWTSSIVCKKKKYFLGYFKTFEEAVRAREEAELKYYGKILNHKER